jgi:hypothetical protein
MGEPQSAGVAAPLPGPGVGMSWSWGESLGPRSAEGCGRLGRDTCGVGGQEISFRRAARGALAFQNLLPGATCFPA